MQFQTRLKRSAHAIDMTPIVDIVFLLLIFFIVTSDTLPLKSLPLETPGLSIDVEPLATQLAIVVDAEEVIYLGSKKSIVGLQEVKDQLAKEIERYRMSHEGVSPSLVLYADRRVSYDTFLKLLSAIQELEIKIRLAYHFEEENGDVALPL